MDAHRKTHTVFLAFSNRLGNGSDGRDGYFLSLALVRVGLGWMIALGANRGSCDQQHDERSDR
jgi:hypothetical protein